jgi:uncharacterized membrane protein
MSTTASPAETQREGTGVRLRSAAIGALFALVLLIPKLVHLRRNPRTWLLFRIVLGFAGAALVVLPLGLWNNWLASIAGLALFLVATLLPAAKADTTTDEKARELGAFVVVNGGRYQPGNALPASAQLFVGAEHVWALDAHFQPLVVIPVADMTSARAEEFDSRWLVHIRWADHHAEFVYRGIFAEHLARVAESTLRSVMRPSLPVLPQRRAASA